MHRGLQNLSDAETIRANILGAFELAATTEDEGERRRRECPLWHVIYRKLPFRFRPVFAAQ